MRPYLLHVHERPIALVKFNYDGDFFITCAKDGEVCLMRTETCERIGTYNPPEKAGAVFAVDITTDSQYVVMASADSKLSFFTFDGQFLYSLAHGGIPKYCEFNQKPGEQNMVLTCNDRFKTSTDGNAPNRIMIFSFDPDETIMCKKQLTISEVLPMKANKVKWGPFDETIIAIFDEGTIGIFDTEKGNLINLIQAHKGVITGMNFSEDRMLMITSSKDQTAKLWAMDEIECVKTFETDRPLNDAAISPLYNVAKSPKYHILLGGGQDAKDVTTTASSSGKFEALLWHMVNDEEIGSIKGHFGPINTLAWRRDGKGFVTGGEDGYVRYHIFDNDYFTSRKFE